MNKKKTLISVCLAVIAVFFIFIIGLRFFLKPIIEYGFGIAGFSKSTVEKAEFGLSGTTLTNLQISSAPPVTIGTLQVFTTAHDAFHGGFSKIIFSNAKASVETPLGPIPFILNGEINNRGADYQLTGDVTGENPFVMMAGAISATYVRQTQKANYRLDLQEGKIDFPGLDVKRLAGWVEADTDAHNENLGINAELTAGSVKIYDVPLQGVTLSASSAAGKMQGVLNGHVADNSGDIAAEATLDQTDDWLDNIAVKVDAQLKNLDKLGKAGLRGQGQFNLSLAGAKQKPAAWQDMAGWQSLAGDATVDAKKLSLPGLVTNADVAAATTLSLDAAQKQLSIKTTNANYSDAAFQLKNIVADLLLAMTDAPTLSGTLGIAEFTQKTSPAYILPVRANLTFRPENGVTIINGDINDKNGLLTAKIKGRHDIKNGRGNLTLTMLPLTLTKGVHSLQEISPASTEYAEDVTGTIGANIDAAWANGKTSSKAELFLKNVSGTVKENPITDISGVVTLSSLIPLTFAKQQIAIGGINVGLPLTNGVVVASLDAARNFTLHDASWDLAKGKISSAPFTLPLDKMTADVTLTATGLDLPELFKVAPMEGLDATGTVNGTLPLQIRGDSVAIVDGVLESTGGGFLRYNPKEVPAFLKDDKNKQIADLRVALKAFEFSALKMTLSGEAGKSQNVGLHLTGKNPEFYEGHPVSLNLNVEGPLQNVLKYSPGSSQIPDSIKKQLESYEKQHAAP